MDIATSCNLGPTTNDHINRVRLYLGVTTIADIASNEGSHVLSWALTGTKKATPTIPWPHQHHPTDTSWSIWRGFLQKSLTTLPSYICSNKHWRLSTPLGDWTTKTPYTY
eukprot:8162511-Ditylum_brightwellii.AAC.1